MGKIYILQIHIKPRTKIETKFNRNARISNAFFHDDIYDFFKNLDALLCQHANLLFISYMENLKIKLLNHLIINDIVLCVCLFFYMNITY